MLCRGVGLRHAVLCYEVLPVLAAQRWAMPLLCTTATRPTNNQAHQQSANRRPSPVP